MKFKDYVKAFAVGACVGFEQACDQLVGSVGVAMVIKGIKEKDKSFIVYGTIFTATGFTNYIRKMIRFNEGDNLGYDKLILGKSFDEWTTEIAKNESEDEGA